MHVFDKGSFRHPVKKFKREGLLALKQLSKFQDKFNMPDTDTTINTIRDTIISGYFGYNLVNMEKHGFDGKNSRNGNFLEVKQCSITAKRLGGTWNDTSLEKAKAFCSKRLFTAIAIWKGASDLQFVVYGKNKKLGEYLQQRIKNRKKNSRATQTISITKLIEWGFKVFVPPGKSISDTVTQLLLYNKGLSKYINAKTVKRI